MNSVNLDNFADPFFLGETKEELRRIRQDFHVHPEIGLVTPRTSRIIADLLRKYGVDEVHEGIDLGTRTVPVLGREGVEREIFDA